jgi:hypothetical protein
VDERDIAKDRELCEKASPPPWTVEQRGCHELGYDIEGPESGMRGMFEREEDAAFCAVSRTALPHYISRTEHLERMLEAAIGILDAFGACPMRAECQRSQTVTPSVFRDRTECKACLRDYVFQKAAKEGAK